MCHCYMCEHFHSHHLVVNGSTHRGGILQKEKKKVSNYGESKIKTAQGP